MSSDTPTPRTDGGCTPIVPDDSPCLPRQTSETPRTQFEIDRCQNELGAIEAGPFIALSKTLERELAALKAENERMKIDAGKAYCVYCGTSGPKADIWKHVTVCDKHPLKTMADKMEEASGMIQVAMLIFDELGLSGNATAVTAVESIQKLKAEIERRDAFMVAAAETLRKTEAENERMREALNRIATEHLRSMEDAIQIAEEALASRGRENQKLGDVASPGDTFTPTSCSPR